MDEILSPILSSNSTLDINTKADIMQNARLKRVNKGGRPKGSSGLNSKQPSAIAVAFKKAGLDWKEDFAKAIKENKRERIKLWLRLLPYMITTSKRTTVKRWKGKASRAAIIALEAMEKDV